MSRCKLTVTCTGVKGKCEAGMRVGDTATFDGVNITGRLCIHAMASMMAKLFAMHQGVNFVWLADPNVATHFCPDEETPVTYEIRREMVG
jgi:uncharacterized repeat protein (TIGR04076 family)